MDDKTFARLIGLLSVWKILPSLLLELIAISAYFFLPVDIATLVVIFAGLPLVLARHLYINMAVLMPATLYAKVLKWPVRFAAIYYIHYTKGTRYFLCFVFFVGAGLIIKLWSRIFDGGIQAALDGQLFQCRVLTLIAEKCLRLDLLENPLMYLPLELLNGERFDTVASGLVQAGQSGDQGFRRAVLDAVTPIFGRKRAIDYLETFSR